MKRILYLSNADINKKNGGGLANLAFYNAIKSIYGEQVDLMIPSECTYDKTSNIIRVPPRNRFQALLSASPHRYKDFLNNYLKKNKSKYDVCVLNGGIYAGNMMDMIHRHGLKVVVIHHNFDKEYYLGNKALITLYGRTGFFVERFEKKSYTKADVNCYLTPQDQKLFETHYGECKNPSYVIWAFEPNSTKVEIPSIEVQQKIVVCGSMNTLQTICGINDLKSNYYGIIRELCPNWKLVLAGRNPRNEVYEFQQAYPDNIEVIPNPDDMSIVTKDASIFLCPTNVGGGLKLRVMDGLRQGLPILVHSVSARGYDSFFDKPYFQIYNDQKSFYRGLSNLLDYCAVGVNRNQIQKEYYETYSFEAGCERMKKVIESCFA